MALATNPFTVWLAEVEAAAVVVQPDDIIAEAHGNLWTFGLDDDQRAAITSDEVEAFIRAVFIARGRWLTERQAGSMRFYCWHDAQAGQLRFSLVSAAHDSLPFGCPIELVKDLNVVIQSFLEDFAVVSSLRVWVVVVP